MTMPTVHSPSAMPAMAERPASRRRGAFVARTLALAAAVAALGVLVPEGAAAQRGRGARQGEVTGSPIDTTFAFARTGQIEIFVPAGDITVTAWDRDAVRVRAEARLGELRLDHTRDRLQLDGRSVGRQYRGGALEIMVPRGASVSMRTFAGAVTVRGLGGRVSADATAGTIDVAELSGNVKLTTTVGDVIGRALSGPVTAVTTSGNVELTDASGAIDAATTSGAVLLRGIRSRDVRAGALNGNVAFEGELHTGGRYTFNAHAGNVVLTIPERSSAAFLLQTFSGHVESEMPLTLIGGTTQRGAPMRFTLGAGDVSVSASTHSGNIIIRRSQRQNP